MEKIQKDSSWKEEDDICGINGCEGKIVLEKVQNCCCHINPPCSACTNRKLVCQECNAVEGEDFNLLKPID